MDELMEQETQNTARNYLLLQMTREAMRGINQDLKDQMYPSYAVEEIDNFSAIRQHLAQHGFTVLGTGFFSMVLENEAYPGLAIKVGCRAEDSGAAYAAWVRDQKHQGNTEHLPDIQMIARDAPDRYYVIMPKYYPNAGRYTRLELGQAYMYCEAGVVRRYISADLKWPSNLPESLKKPLTRMIRFFKDVAVFDLHANNIMLDQDGCIIITDPVSFKHGE